MATITVVDDDGNVLLQYKLMKFGPLVLGQRSTLLECRDKDEYDTATGHREDMVELTFKPTPETRTGHACCPCNKEGNDG